MAKPSDNGMVSRVLHKLSKRRRPEKVSKTLRFVKDTFEQFENLSTRLGFHPADVLDAFMEEFIEDALRRDAAAIKPKKPMPLSHPRRGEEDDEEEEDEASDGEKA